MEFIDSDPVLNHLCEQLTACSWMAVDTEFERTNTYYPELCLLQVAANGTVAVIDPLAISDLQPLYDVFYDTSIIKIFHSARQDLELFFHEKGKVPDPVFDTQIAAALLGYDEQIGYAGLVNEVLGVDLGKSHARTDWKRRPLRPSQLQYAVDDVVYLARLYEILSDRLKESGQHSLHKEECRALMNPALYEPDPDNMWKKIRAAKRLNGNTLAVLKRLAAWRETTARAENKPRKWILPDHTVVEMARARPADHHALCQIKGMPKRVYRRHGNRLLEIIGSAG